jgi:Protein of unknown function (DUF3047)
MRTVWILSMTMCVGGAFAQASGLPALDDAAQWQLALLPRQQLPQTRLTINSEEGRPVLRIESNGSYGNWIYRLPPAVQPGGTLSWRWRVDKPLAMADLRQRGGDDAVVKLCVMFDLPLERVPFVERQKLRMARLATGEALPAATLCYVWDAQLPAHTVLPNAYTDRMRWMVLRGAETPVGSWRTESRDLRADFLRVFGAEADGTAPVRAVLIGADADNTGGEGLAYLADLRWRLP